MSNVHGLADMRRAQQANHRAASQSTTNANTMFSFIPGSEDEPAPVDPRKEKFHQMWQMTFCPRLRLKSVTSVLAVLQILYFIAALIYTGVAAGGLNENFFLGMQIETLQRFGMRMPWAVKYQFEVQRLFTPWLLHFGFSHLVITVLMVLIFGSLVESVLGPLRMLLFCFVSIIGSNLFACVMSDKYAIGSDPLIFSFIGAMFAMLLTYWPMMGDNFCAKICAIFMLIFVTILVAMLLSMGATAIAKATGKV